MPGNAGIIGGRSSANTTVAGGIWDLTTQQQERGASNWTGLPLGSLENPASSATAIRNSGNTTNGAYWYQIPGGSLLQLYTDFTTWSSYSFVLVNRFSSADNLQYLTTANFATDLTVANTTAPTISKFFIAIMIHGHQTLDKLQVVVIRQHILVMEQLHQIVHRG
jgi:hypothetical protein